MLILYILHFNIFRLNYTICIGMYTNEIESFHTIYVTFIRSFYFSSRNKQAVLRITCKAGSYSILPNLTIPYFVNMCQSNATGLINHIHEILQKCSRLHGTNANHVKWVNLLMVCVCVCHARHMQHENIVRYRFILFDIGPLPRAQQTLAHVHTVSICFATMISIMFREYGGNQKCNTPTGFHSQTNQLDHIQEMLQKGWLRSRCQLCEVSPLTLHRASVCMYVYI